MPPGFPAVPGFSQLFIRFVFLALPPHRTVSICYIVPSPFPRFILNIRFVIDVIDRYSFMHIICNLSLYLDMKIKI